MSISIRSILWFCVAIFGLNVYLYVQESNTNYMTEKPAVENTLVGEHNNSGQTGEVFNTVD